MTRKRLLSYFLFWIMLINTLSSVTAEAEYIDGAVLEKEAVLHTEMEENKISNVVTGTSVTNKKNITTNIGLGSSVKEEDFNQIGFAFVHDGLNYEVTVTGSAIKPGELMLVAPKPQYDFKGKIVIPSTVVYEDIPFQVTSIYENAFLNKYTLEATLELPYTLRKIGKQAFFGCKGLTGDLIIPDSVEEIGESAFYGCSGFDGTLKLSKRLSEIKAGTFVNCKNFTGKLIIPGTIKNTEGFEGCNGFTSLLLQEGLEKISGAAFRGCSNIKGELKIPESVKSIGAAAFMDCKSLTGTLEIRGDIELPEVKLPEDAGGFYYSLAFSGTGIEKVIIHEGIQKLARQLFMDCLELKEIYIPNSVIDIDKRTFSSFYTGENLNIAIYCNENSYAHTYAIENGFTYVLLDYVEPELEVTYQPEEWLYEKDSKTLTASVSNLSKTFSLKANKEGCTFSSSHPKTAEVNARGEVTLKGTGTTVLTARSASQEETAAMTLSVFDFTPKMPENTLTVNQAVTNPAGFFIYPVQGSEVLTDGSFYTYEKASQTYTPISGITYGRQGEHSYQIQLSREMQNKTYAFYVKTEVQKEVYYLPLKIKVVSVKPKLSVKAASINAFYTDEASRTSRLSLVNPNGLTITGASLDSELEKWFEVRFSGTGEISCLLKPVTPETEIGNITKKGSLQVQTVEYKDPVPVPVTILVIKKAPVLVQSEALSQINTWLDSGNGAAAAFEVQEKEKGQNRPLCLSAAAFLGEDQTKSLYQGLAWEGCRLFLPIKNPADFQKTVRTKIAVREENWLEPVVLTHQVQAVRKKPEAKLSKKTLFFDRTIPGAFGEAWLTFTAKPGSTGYEKLPGTVTAVKNSGKAPVLVLEQTDETHYRLRAAADGNTQKGTYTYQISPRLTDGTALKPVTLKLTVTEAKKETAVKAKALKGSSLDLAAREHTGMAYSLTASNQAVTVSGAALSGEAGSLFALEEIRKDALLTGIRIRAKQEAELQAGKTYSVPVKITLRSGYDQSPLPETGIVLKIKAKESILRARINQTKATLYTEVENSREEFRVSLAAPSGAELEEIKHISKKIPEGAFEIQTDPGEGRIQISIKDSSQLLKNKSYAFQFGLRAKGGNKYKTQSIRIKIK